MFKQINDAFDQGRFRSYNGEVNLFVQGKGCQGFDVFGINGDRFRQASGAGIARSTVIIFSTNGLWEIFQVRVCSRAAAADNENFSHVALLKVCPFMFFNGQINQFIQKL